MNAQGLQNIIAKGEGKHAEFLTETATEPVARVVCAFLNSSGGRLLLGVGKQGQVLGIADAEANARRLEKELPTLISPTAVWTVEHHREDNHSVLKVEVPEGQDKPYVVGGAIYLRRHGQVVAATRDEISDLIRKRIEASQRWERQLALGVDREDLNDELVLQTIQRARKLNRWGGTQDDDDIDGFLNKLGLAAEGSITNAGLLLYGRAPTRVLPQARVRLLVIPEGKTGDHYRVDRWFERCLLQNLEEIPEALAVYLGGVESRFSGSSWERSDRPIYPGSAVAEGIINALIHRDYSLNGSITISIYQDSLRISNPGRLPIKLSDLKRDHQSLPPNPDVAHVCYLHGLIEKVGRGTQRIVEDCRKAQLREPKWQTSALETTLTMFSAASRTSKDLNERQQQILKALGERGLLRSSDIIKLLGTGVTDRTVRSDLQWLVDLGLLIRRGRGRSTSYVALKKDVIP
jgi:ATP-dependent DNA helicase RecG